MLTRNELPVYKTTGNCLTGVAGLTVNSSGNTLHYGLGYICYSVICDAVSTDELDAAERL
jgi:hypothetical protein